MGKGRYRGPSLWDRYAAAAITGLVQFADAPNRLNPKEIAFAAANIADAMVAFAAAVERGEPIPYRRPAP